MSFTKLRCFPEHIFIPQRVKVRDESESCFLTRQNGRKSRSSALRSSSRWNMCPRSTSCLHQFSRLVSCYTQPGIHQNPSRQFAICQPGRGRGLLILVGNLENWVHLLSVRLAKIELQPLRRSVAVENGVLCVKHVEIICDLEKHATCLTLALLKSLESLPHRRPIDEKKHVRLQFVTLYTSDHLASSSGGGCHCTFEAGRCWTTEAAFHRLLVMFVRPKLRFLSISSVKKTGFIFILLKGLSGCDAQHLCVV